MLPILFRDPRFVVLDKPAGLAVHPGPRGGPSVEDVLAPLSKRRDGPWLAHRLDRDTAGCLLIALRRSALIAAQAEFAAGRARKTYWAIVDGAPPAESGCVENRLRKHTGPSGWRMAAAPDGQRALTHWRLVAAGATIAWLELTPRTGRTHQVRAHCAALGCPVRGDPIYGQGNGPLQLLARSLALDLDPPLAATAPPPAHMRQALCDLGWEPRAPARG